MVDAVTLLAVSSVGLAVDGETIAYVSGGARTARCLAADQQEPATSLAA
jgi:hypothetical protein